MLAAIDIGSNSIRMSIGQILEDGHIETVEEAQRTVRLGQDSFRRSYLGRVTMQAAVSILRDFRKRIELYDIKHVWTVATSAVREARNSDVFLDRVYTAAGFEVDVIEASQEGRLTVSAVRSDMGDDQSLLGAETVICEVGGGSTVLTFLRHGEITASHSLTLGAIRLQEILGTGSESWAQMGDMIQNETDLMLVSLEEIMPLKKIKTFFAIGADVRFVASQCGSDLENKRFRSVSRKDFDRLVEKLRNMNTEQFVQRYDLSFSEAETLGPALMVYQALLHSTKAVSIIVPYVSMRDGLLLELSRRAGGRQDQSLAKEVIQSALSIAEKYKVNIRHAKRVAHACVKLFDVLAEEHGLTFRNRILLESAALLHEVGKFVAIRAYHKHSYYIIRFSEIFGLTRKEVNIAAHVARYHRHSRPKPSHLEYMSFSRDGRVLVNKLASILRLCKALDVSDVNLNEGIDFELRGDRLDILVKGMPEWSLRRKILHTQSDMFEDVYGINVNFAGR